MYMFIDTFIKKELEKNKIEHNENLINEIKYQRNNFCRNCYYESYSSYRGVWLDYNEGGYEKNFHDDNWFWYPEMKETKDGKFSNNWPNAEKKYIKLLIKELARK